LNNPDALYVEGGDNGADDCHVIKINIQRSIFNTFNVIDEPLLNGKLTVAPPNRVPSAWNKLIVLPVKFTSDPVLESVIVKLPGTIKLTIVKIPLNAINQRLNIV
jgi:hypothetical protein